MAFADQALSLPAPDSRTFRDALGRFATGVAFITAAVDGEPTGLIVNPLTSVSLNPPLVAFTPARASLTWGRMRRTGRFGVNVLGMQHEGFAKRVAPAGADRFADIDWVLGPGGAPLLTDALATLECEIVAEHPAGVSVDGLDIAAARVNPTGTLDTSFGSDGRTTIPAASSRSRTPSRSSATAAGGAVVRPHMQFPARPKAASILFLARLRRPLRQVKGH